MTMETLLTNPYTLGVQGKYANYTRVYKGTCIEGFQMIYKNLLSHFPLKFHHPQFVTPYFAFCCFNFVCTL